MGGNSKKVVAKALFFIIKGFKIFFHLPNGQCRFTPTCSEYAREAVEKLTLFYAFVVITRRILRCHPWCSGGFDPVPENSNTTKG